MRRYRQLSESQRRVLRIVRWPLFLGVLAAFFVWLGMASSGGCAPGAPELKASDVTGASVTITNPSGGGAPIIKTIDLTKPGERELLVAAYQSMAPWRHERGKPPSPDLSLTLTLTKDRQWVIHLSRDNFPYVLLDKYGKGELTSSVYLQPNGMYGFILGFAEQ